MTFPVGIDIGNSKCVVAVFHDGVVDALLNEESTRETPTLVHFAANHRLFGTAGANHSTSNPSSTISQLKRLFFSNTSGDELLRLPYQTSIGADGFVSVEVRYLGEHHVFTAVEMLAMLLSHLRRSAERVVGSAISDCVIGVPSYFTEQQKRAYLDAALIAGWNPLKLLHDGTAAALDYRATREGAGDTVTVVFVDVGHCDTQVTVVRFRGRKTRVIAEASDGDLGGRDFDELVFWYFVDRFGEQHGIDVRSNAKATARLRASCEKAKRVLSANREAQLAVDSLMDGVDANGVITREKFERMSSRLVDRIQGLFRDALKRADVGADEVHSVELVGSGSRAPAISKALTEVFGREMSRTLNGSECIACGCALQCDKMLRRVFRDDDREQKRHGRVTSGSETSSSELIAFGTKSDLSKAREKEQNLRQQDKRIERAKEERNTLEAYIYKSRNKAKGITEESERNEISAKLTQTEEWLFEKGDDEPEDVYKDKLEELKLLLSPIGDHGEKALVHARTRFQTSIKVPPVPESSLISSTREVSPECSGAQLSDQISPRKNKTSSRGEIEVNVSTRTREQGPSGISTRGTASAVTPKKHPKRLGNRSWCQCCRETDAKSPSRR